MKPWLTERSIVTLYQLRAGELQYRLFTYMRVPHNVFRERFEFIATIITKSDNKLEVRILVTKHRNFPQLQHCVTMTSKYWGRDGTYPVIGC